MANEVNDMNFETEVLKSDKPVMVDFWAEWCGPCKAFMPMVEKMASEFEGVLKVCKLNVDNAPETPSKYGIRSIPTVLFFKGGELVEQIVGVPRESDFRKIIQKVTT